MSNRIEYSNLARIDRLGELLENAGDPALWA